MNAPKIVHVRYVGATPEALWEALTNPGITERYWAATRIESDWLVGSTILYRRHGVITDEHRVLRVEPPRLLCHTFHPVFDPALRREAPSRVTFEIAADGSVVRLILVHDLFEPDSAVYRACREGWPRILDNLKTLLETGRPLPEFDFPPAFETPHDP